MPDAAYFNPTAYGDLQGANLQVFIWSRLLADQKFMTIFSMLFGAGIVLMATRAADPGDARRRHYRRMAWLGLHRPAARPPPLGRRHPVPLRRVWRARISAAPAVAETPVCARRRHHQRGIGVLVVQRRCAAQLAGSRAYRVHQRDLAAAARRGRRRPGRLPRGLARTAPRPLGDRVRLRDLHPARLGAVAGWRPDAHWHGALQARRLQRRALAAVLRRAGGGPRPRPGNRRPTGCRSISASDGTSGRSSRASSSTTGGASRSASATSAS